MNNILIFVDMTIKYQCIFARNRADWICFWGIIYYE